MDEKNIAKSHKVLLVNRGNGAFSGVVDVLSFDVAEILLETELGMLLIKGHACEQAVVGKRGSGYRGKDRLPDLLRCQERWKTGRVFTWKAV